MHCVVYQLRQRGAKLLPEAVRSRPVEGYLVFEQRGGWPVHDAKLLDKRGSSKELLPTLEHASLKRVDNGIMLTGLEYAGAGVPLNRQAWWIVPGPMDDLTVR